VKRKIYIFKIYSKESMYIIFKVEKKVKESCNRPSVAQRVPGGLGFQIS